LGKKNGRIINLADIPVAKIGNLGSTARGNVFIASSDRKETTDEVNQKTDVDFDAGIERLLKDYGNTLKGLSEK